MYWDIDTEWNEIMHSVFMYNFEQFYAAFKANVQKSMSNDKEQAVKHISNSSAHNYNYLVDTCMCRYIASHKSDIYMKWYTE